MGYNPKLIRRISIVRVDIETQCKRVLNGEKEVHWWLRVLLAP